MMDSKYNEYISFLSSYRDELLVYLENEREKRLALLNNDLGRLEAMIKVQQAEMMKFRGLESKRTMLQSKLGLPDAKAKEVLSVISDTDSRKKIEVLFADLADIAEQIQEQNRQSLELAESNLRILDLIHRGGEAGTGSTYYGPETGRRKVYSTGAAFEEKI